MSDDRADETGAIVAIVNAGGLDDEVLAMPLPLAMAECETRYLEAILARAGGNKTRAAEIAGIPRLTLLRKLRRYGIEVRPGPPVITRTRG